MNKATLIEKWKFTGVDVMEYVERIYNLLNEYGHTEVTYYGIATYLDAFIDAKRAKIEEMMKSPFYVGNLQIAFDVNLTIPFVASEAQRLGQMLIGNVCRREDFLKTTNPEGKTSAEVLVEILKDMPTTFNVSNLDLFSKCHYPEQPKEFNCDGYYIPSIDLWNKFYNYCHRLAKIGTISLSKDQAEQLNTDYSTLDPKLNGGMFVARAFNRMMNKYGYDQNNKEYAKAFAAYSDASRERVQTLKFVYSLNPIDFLTASFGHSWSSCQTIDFLNKRGIDQDHVYRGMSMQGNVSYALDDVTILTYLSKADADIAHPENNTKIYRQWWHINGTARIQGRLYPQSNDSTASSILRDQITEFVKKVIGEENKVWTMRTDHTAGRDDQIYTRQGSLNYADYNATSFYCRRYDIGGSYDDIFIGHEGLCFNSGISLDGCADKMCYHTGTRYLPVEYREDTNPATIVL